MRIASVAMRRGALGSSYDVIRCISAELPEVAVGTERAVFDRLEVPFPDPVNPRFELRLERVALAVVVSEYVSTSLVRFEIVDGELHRLEM
jgi:hypothetical protein